MSYKKSNYYIMVRELQKKVKKLQDEYVFISLIQCWNILKNRKECFCEYKTFLKYMGEGNLNEKINKNNTLFD